MALRHCSPGSAYTDLFFLRSRPVQSDIVGKLQDRAQRHLFRMWAMRLMDPVDSAPEAASSQPPHQKQKGSHRGSGRTKPPTRRQGPRIKPGFAFFLIQAHGRPTPPGSGYKTRKLQATRWVDVRGLKNSYIFFCSGFPRG